jgi:hypothetical protein
LYQSEEKLPIGSRRLPSLGGKRWNPSIGRIDNKRRSRSGALDGREDRQVVSLSEVALGRESRKQRRSAIVELCALGLGKDFLVGVLRRAIKWRVKFLAPNALEIWFAPRRFYCQIGSCRSLSRGADDRRRKGGGNRGNGNSYDPAWKTVGHNESPSPCYVTITKAASDVKAGCHDLS